MRARCCCARVSPSTPASLNLPSRRWKLCRNLTSVPTLCASCRGLLPQRTAKLGDLGDKGEPAVPRTTSTLPEQMDEPERAVGPRNLPEIEQAIENALTESELYQSYNSIPKSIAPLENALARAPEDVR